MVGLLLAGVMALGAADCRTPLGIPCSTIRFQVTQWRLFRDGPLDVTHFSEVRTFAVRGDGSFVETAEQQEMSRWFGRGERTAGSASLYLAPDDLVVRVDHQQKTITRRPPILWDERPYRYSSPGDRTCVSGIRHWGAHFFLRGPDRVAGVPVIKWIGSNPGGGYTEVYLAPSLDCRPLKTHIVIRKLGIFPTFVSTTEAVSVELGEPKAELFALPSGYREVEDPMRKGLSPK
jgi:hypothetical protein